MISSRFVKLSIFFLPVYFLLLTLLPASAQQNLSPDELFTQARDAAFNKKDYDLAIMLARQSLIKSPDYPDIHVFLGRIYTWTHRPDSARMEFSYVLDRHPDNADAAGAFANLEHWNHHDTLALRYCNQGLRYHPGDQKLMLKKARILKAFTTTARRIR